MTFQGTPEKKESEESMEGMVPNGNISQENLRCNYLQRKFQRTAYT
jgi:hypothetical protein